MRDYQYTGTPTGSNGTATFWKHYAVRNGYVSEPTTSATPHDVAIRLSEFEQRFEIAAEWLEDARVRIAYLERRLPS